MQFTFFNRLVFYC